VAVDSQIVADPQRSGINKTDSAARPHASLQKNSQCRKGAGNLFDKPAVAQPARKLALQMLANVLEIEMLERAIVGVVKQNQNGHDLTQAHLAAAVPMGLAIFDQMPLVLRFKSNSKLVQIIKKCNDIHGGLLAGKLLTSWSTQKFYGRRGRLFKSIAYPELTLIKACQSSLTTIA